MILLSIFIIATYLSLIMAQNSQKHEEIMVTIGKRQVPLSRVNKPHNVVVGGMDKPIPDLKQFPDIEPEAKAREEKLEAEREKRKEEL